MCDRFMTVEEIKKVPIHEKVRLMETEEFMTPLEYYIEHDDVPKRLKIYNRIIMFICYAIGSEIIRPILIFFLGKRRVAAVEYVYKHHEIIARLHFFGCLIIGASLTGDLIGGAVRLLRYLLTGGIFQ